MMINIKNMNRDKGIYDLSSIYEYLSSCDRNSTLSSRDPNKPNVGQRVCLCGTMWDTLPRLRGGKMNGIQAASLLPGFTKVDEEEQRKMQSFIYRQ